MTHSRIYTTLKGYVGGLGQEVYHQYHAWDSNEFWHIINTGILRRNTVTWAKSSVKISECKRSYRNGQTYAVVSHFSVFRLDLKILTPLQRLNFQKWSRPLGRLCWNNLNWIFTLETLQPRGRLVLFIVNLF